MKAKGNYRVRIKVGDAELDIEGAQRGVVKIVEALSDVLRGSRKPPSVNASIPAQSATPTPRSFPIDIRSFFAEKAPSSDVEAAAAAAYYYQYLAPQNERSETIDSDSLQQAFRLARRPLPKKTIYTLTNARNAGYLDSGGSPGLFRLNPVGYNLVEHTLGSSSQGAGVKAKSRKPRKKNSRK